MSNMTLKDWRNVVPRLSRRDARERTHRQIMDGAMVAATICSALATAFTGGIAVFQYRAAQDALIAADRNRAFEALFDALAPACRTVEVTGLVLRVLPVVSADTPLETYRKQSRMLTDGLEKLMPALYDTYGRFGIWAKRSEAEGYKEIYDRYVARLQTLQIQSFGALETEEDLANAWKHEIFTAAYYCSSMHTALIAWFREGQTLPRRLFGPPPLPKTSIPDVFFDLRLIPPKDRQ